MNQSLMNIDKHERLETIQRFSPADPSNGARHQAIDPRRAFSVIHISDPHLSRQYYREHIKSFKLLLRTIIDRGFDHLVIRGDIVSTADPDDFFLAREILGRFDLLSAEKLTLVPGNHDIFGGPHRAADVLSFPRHIRGLVGYLCCGGQCPSSLCTTISTIRDASKSRFWRRIELKTMCMRKRRKALKLLKALNVQHVVHGHFHCSEIYVRQGITFLNGAGAVCDDPVPQLKCNQLLYSSNSVNVGTILLPIPYQVDTASVPLGHSRTQRISPGLIPADTR